MTFSGRACFQGDALPFVRFRASLMTREKKEKGHDFQHTFDQFWAAFPRKRSRLDAMKVWERMKPDAKTVDAILGAIEVQRRCKQWRDGFIPYPATWLRKGGWLDELGPADFYQAKL